MIEEISMLALKRARMLFFEVQNKRKTIGSSYNTYRSPSVWTAHNRGRGRADPVAQSLHYRDGLKRGYVRDMKRLMAFQRYVSDRIPDPAMKAMIISYFFCGMPIKSIGGPKSMKAIEEYIERLQAEPVEDACDGGVSSPE